MSVKQVKSGRRRERGDRRDDGRMARLKFHQAQTHDGKYEPDEPVRKFQNGIAPRSKWTMDHMHV